MDPTPFVMRFALRAEEPNLEELYGEYDEQEQRCTSNQFETASSSSGATATVGNDADTEYP